MPTNHPLRTEPEAERTIIGGLLLSAINGDDQCSETVFANLVAADFAEPECRTMFAAMQRLHAAGRPLEHGLLVSTLKADGMENPAGNLLEAAQRVATTASIGHYVRVVADAARQRKAFCVVNDTLHGLRNCKGEVGNVLAKLLAQLPTTPTASSHGPILTCLADVEPRPVSWLWPERIPAGRITLLVGRPGEGKSFLTTDATARVTTGTPWPDGSDCPQGSVLLLTAEDDPADTIRPRLDAHHADVRRVHLLSAVRRVDDDGPHDRMITLADVDAIEATLKRLPDCRLIVVDPIGSFLGGRTDAHRDNEVRGVLAPIAALAEKHGPAVLVVAHRRKSAGSIADDLALGSRAFTGIARAVWHLTRDAEDKARRLLLPGKNNLAREGDGLAFSIIGEPPRIAWEREPVAMSADDALAVECQSREQKPGPDAEAFDAASDWLRLALADGPRLAKELKDEWRDGQDGSERTLRRARQSLSVEVFRPEVPGSWWWRLPDKVANDPEDKQLGHLGHLAENSKNMPIFDPVECKVAKFQQLGHLGPLGPNRVRVTI
ncbi:MAG: AAA family ATPase [Pirellulales bacterium]|nr:AAA family ATPase [Pirellulales bacterium]